MNVRRTAPVLASLAVLLGSAACGSGGGTTTGSAYGSGPSSRQSASAPATGTKGAGTAGSSARTSASTSAGASAAGAGRTLALGRTSLGRVLVGPDGNAVYRYDPDHGGPSTCYDACATAWPPLAGPVTAGPGVAAARLGTVDRRDGTAQATYGGWPLYYFAGDTAPGRATGQGSGGVWWVLDGAGRPVGR